ncbi:GNAT family N-acetyltransferase [Mesonia aquimarina]|uniref:GNAT family N-acetyltransferase n=1 Tax=Mesonia aquimarina TaxID=1504967 RepID=UPI000EF62262|nr:GNAT family N-acetyltransferase [Mesonia aquimarina]
MKFIEVSILSESNKREILKLWNNEYPEKLGFQHIAEFEKYLAELTAPSHILMLDHNSKVKIWYVCFTRENEKWFALILDSSFQGKGLGTKLLNRAKEKEPELNAWVIDHNNDRKKNGEHYNSPLDFYLKNGFELITHNRLELKKISAVKIKWKHKNESL